jgi:heptosyltransferase-3
MNYALFIKFRNLGDSVILTSAIQAMPSSFGVDVLCFEDSKEIFVSNPRVRHVFSMSREGTKLQRIFSKIRLIAKIWQENYEVCIHFSGELRGVFLGSFSNARRKVILNDQRNLLIKKLLGWRLVRINKVNRHSVQLDLDLLRSENLFPELSKPPNYFFPITNSAATRVDRWLREHSLAQRRFVLIHAASRWTFKQLPLTVWVELIGQLRTKFPLEIVLSGSSGDILLNDKLSRLVHPCLPYPMDFSLAETAALYSKAHLLISIDSLSIHLASAVGLPTAAIFGPSGEANWAPWGVPYRIVEQSSRFPCRPCGRDGCGGSKASDCLITMPSSSVLYAVESLISELNVYA